MQWCLQLLPYCYSFRLRLHNMKAVVSKEIVLNPAIIRRTCKQLAVEEDSQRARELLLLLDAAVRDDQKKSGYN
jgi:hypothetical protein